MRTIRNISNNSIVSTEAFNYDAAGNVTSAPSSSFAYDTNNRLCGSLWIELCYIWHERV